MAGSLDSDVQKLDSIVSNILNGKRSDSSLGQRLSETYGQAAAKVDPSGGNCSRDALQRILDVKGVFDWKPIKPLLESCETESHLYKSEEISSQLREKGNEFYKDKKIDKALRAYTLAIAFAPVASEELALAYANRSAVLLQMNKPHEAMADVQRSLSKCPQKLKDKLEERVAKCKAMLEKVPKGSSDEDETLKYAKKLFEIQQPNPKIPSAQSFVQMNYSLGKGRHLVVTEDVPAGTVLLVDHPAVSVMNNLLLWEIDHCHHCAKSMINGIHCTECVFGIFCSEKCRELACGDKGLHHLEHSYLPILHSYNATHKDIQALRLLATVGPDFLLKLWQSKDKLYFQNNTAKTGELLGFNENGVYDTKSYLPTFHLISHELENIFEGGISVGTLNALHALFLKGLLKQYSPFFQAPVGKPNSIEDFEDFIASVILKHLENIKYNAISLSKIVNNNKKSIAFAAAMYPLLSICNHSCDPNCVPVKQSKYLQTSLVALKHLRKGDELFITYKPLYNQMKTSDRQSFLADNYRFICMCEACVENWGPSSVQLYPNEGMLVLEPTICDSCSELGPGKDGKPHQCRDCSQKDMQRAKKMREMVKILFKCHDLVEKREYVKNLQLLPSILDYFGSNGYPSYFSLYYIAMDLFKRALVQCVSDK